ncbi:MAG: phosphoribosylglycinamide formyltransferase [Terriglobia bacterium]
MKKLGILLSGRGSNFEAIARHIDSGALKAEIALVLSNVAEAPGLGRAQQRGLQTVYLPSRGMDRNRYDQEMITALKTSQVDLICLAGFMRLLSGTFVKEFHGRILNIHPSLLPAFPGLHAQRQALQYGVRYSGCTVHFVDEGLDSGPIILQSIVPVLAGDTEQSLSDRILKEEHQLYSKAIRLVLEDRARLEDRRVIILPEKEFSD